MLQFAHRVLCFSESAFPPRETILYAASLKQITNRQSKYGKTMTNKKIVSNKLQQFLTVPFSLGQSSY